MEVMYRCCCGLDVHKNSVTACVLWAEGNGQNRKEKRRFSTFTRDLMALGDWLRECRVSHVAMESTGVYWKPVWHILEGQFELLLANAQHVKAIPGHKTDPRDASWLAELLQHGLLRSSFVPPEPIQGLRDLTRYRVNLAQECNRVANRIQKVLEDANVKLASVATDPLGASGRAMLKASIAGEQDVEKLAEMARGLLRRKIPQLQLALEGRVSAHHRFLLQELLGHLEFLESKMLRLEQEIEERLRPFEDTIRRLCTVPGIDRVSAGGIVSEIGLDMTQFPDAPQLAVGLVSGQLGERRQTQEWADPQGQSLVAPALMPMCLGRIDQERQLPVGIVSALGTQGLESRYRRRGPHPAGHRLSHSQRSGGVS